MINKEELRMQMVDLVSANGYIALAKKCGVTVGYLKDITAGRRDPGPKVLKALNYRHVDMYETVKK